MAKKDGNSTEQDMDAALLKLTEFSIEEQTAELKQLEEERAIKQKEIEELNDKINNKKEILNGLNKRKRDLKSTSNETLREINDLLSRAWENLCHPENTFDEKDNPVCFLKENNRSQKLLETAIQDANNPQNISFHIEKWQKEFEQIFEKTVLEEEKSLISMVMESNKMIDKARQLSKTLQKFEEDEIHKIDTKIVFIETAMRFLLRSPIPSKAFAGVLNETRMWMQAFINRKDTLSWAIPEEIRARFILLDFMEGFSCQLKTPTYDAQHKNFLLLLWEGLYDMLECRPSERDFFSRPDPEDVNKEKLEEQIMWMAQICGDILPKGPKHIDLLSTIPWQIKEITHCLLEEKVDHQQAKNTLEYWDSIDEATKLRPIPEFTSLFYLINFARILADALREKLNIAPITQTNPPFQIDPLNAYENNNPVQNWIDEKEESFSCLETAEESTGTENFKSHFLPLKQNFITAVLENNHFVFNQNADNLQKEQKSIEKIYLLEDNLLGLREDFFPVLLQIYGRVREDEQELNRFWDDIQVYKRNVQANQIGRLSKLLLNFDIPESDRHSMNVFWINTVSLMVHVEKRFLNYIEKQLSEKAHPIPKEELQHLQKLLDERFDDSPHDPRAYFELISEKSTSLGLNPIQSKLKQIKEMEMKFNEIYTKLEEMLKEPSYNQNSDSTCHLYGAARRKSLSPNSRNHQSPRL